MSTLGTRKSGDIVQGVFSLKYLVLFTKCTNLSSSVEIYLKNDYPLIVKFMVASLGELKLCLSPNVESHQ
jgi:proliferating cell nuclear antigen